MARVLVTGVSGQIGSYAAEALLARGHEVLGLTRPDDPALPPGVRPARGSLLRDGIGSLLDDNGDLIAIVHLAGRSSVGVSWEDPLGTFDANAAPTVSLAFAIAQRGGPRLVNASSAEIFGRASVPVQDENTPLAPISPYGVSKAAGHMAVVVAREGYRAPMSNLIFYAGESERRASTFVFRTITRGVAAIRRGEASELVLGDLSPIRDFSHASDLAEAAVVAALTAPPNDYICASGAGHSVRELAEAACMAAGVPVSNVRSSPVRYRPSDIPSLVGDSSRLRGQGWQPRITFATLVQRIVDHDLGVSS